LEWDLLLSQIGPKLNTYFIMSGSSTHDAEDLVQDTLVRLVRKVESVHYNKKLANLQTYAYGLARFIRLEAYR
jgi:DNA-directed RNA polymerase specialized sigma24 family protein